MIYTATVISYDGKLLNTLTVHADGFYQAADRALAATAADAGHYHVDGVPDTSELRIIALIEGEVAINELLKLID